MHLAFSCNNKKVTKTKLAVVKYPEYFAAVSPNSLATYGIFNREDSLELFTGLLPCFSHGNTWKTTFQIMHDEIILNCKTVFKIIINCLKILPGREQVKVLYVYVLNTVFAPLLG